MAIVAVTGKWRRRAIETLLDAEGFSLTIRQLRIRCGIQAHQDRSGSLMRNVLTGMVGQGLIHLAKRGHYYIADNGRL